MFLQFRFDIFKNNWAFAIVSPWLLLPFFLQFCFYSNLQFFLLWIVCNSFMSGVPRSCVAGGKERFISPFFLSPFFLTFSSTIRIQKRHFNISKIQKVKNPKIFLILVQKIDLILVQTIVVMKIMEGIIFIKNEHLLTKSFLQITQCLREKARI